jgi:hypothetical protein
MLHLSLGNQNMSATPPYSPVSPYYSPTEVSYSPPPPSNNPEILERHIQEDMADRGRMWVSLLRKADIEDFGSSENGCHDIERITSLVGKAGRFVAKQLKEKRYDIVAFPQEDRDIRRKPRGTDTVVVKITYPDDERLFGAMSRFYLTHFQDDNWESICARDKEKQLRDVDGSNYYVDFASGREVRKLTDLTVTPGSLACLRGQYMRTYTARVQVVIGDLMRIQISNPFSSLCTVTFQVPPCSTLGTIRDIYEDIFSESCRERTITNIHHFEWYCGFTNKLLRTLEEDSSTAIGTFPLQKCRYSTNNQVVLVLLPPFLDRQPNDEAPCPDESTDNETVHLDGDAVASAPDSSDDEHSHETNKKQRTS